MSTSYRGMRCYARPLNEKDKKLYEIIKRFKGTLFPYVILIHARMYSVKSWLYDNDRHIDVNNNISTYYLTLQRFGEGSVHCNITLSIKYRYTLTKKSFRRETVGYSCSVEQCVHSIYSMDASIVGWRPKNIIANIYTNLSISSDFDNSDIVREVNDVELYHSILISPLLVRDIMNDLQCLKRNIKYVENFCRCEGATFDDKCECGLICSFR